MTVRPPQMVTYDGRDEVAAYQFAVCMMNMGTGETKNERLLQIWNYTNLGLIGAAKSWLTSKKQDKYQDAEGFAEKFLKRFTGFNVREHVKKYCSSKRKQNESHHDFLNRLELLKECKQHSIGY